MGRGHGQIIVSAQNDFNLDVLKPFGLEHAPEEWEEFFKLAGEAILTSVVAKIEAGLPEDKREEFFQLFERPATDEEKAEFFTRHVPNFKELLLGEIARFKSEAIANIKNTDGETAGAATINEIN